MGMSIGSAGKKDIPKPTMNVTPLVDVALVVLIIFMVVTPMMTKTFWLNLPKQEEKKAETPPPPSNNEPLVLTLDKDGVIRVNKTVLQKQELAERLPRMLAAKKNKIVYFDAADGIPYGKAVEVMDLGRAAGARSIAMLTESVMK